MERLNVYVDIDGTICESVGLGYDKATPIQKAIDKVNKMYDQGHVVTLYTARGTVTGKNWRFLTQDQLKAWGVKYSELKFGKPDWDIYIGDKAVNATDWRTLP